MRTRLARSAGACAVAVLAVVLSSCGDGRVKVYPVQGKVVDEKGKPAAGAMVMFHPVNPPGGNVEAVVGTADTEGVYRLTTYTAGDGAPTGPNATPNSDRPGRARRVYVPSPQCSPSAATSNRSNVCLSGR